MKVLTVIFILNNSVYLLGDKWIEFSLFLEKFQTKLKVYEVWLKMSGFVQALHILLLSMVMHEQINFLIN